MIDWKFYAKGPDSSFDYYEVQHRNQLISVSKIGDNRYTLWWWRGANLTIKESFDAGNWEQALDYALYTIEFFIREKAEYWQNLKTDFDGWIKEASTNG